MQFESSFPTSIFITAKRKAILVTGFMGSYGCQTWMIPHFLDDWLTDGGKFISLTHRLPFIRTEDSW
jgi:hypothetical protein